MEDIGNALRGGGKGGIHLRRGNTGNSANSQHGSQQKGMNGDDMIQYGRNMDKGRNQLAEKPGLENDSKNMLFGRIPPTPEKVRQAREAAANQERIENATQEMYQPEEEVVEEKEPPLEFTFKQPKQKKNRRGKKGGIKATKLALAKDVEKKTVAKDASKENVKQALPNLQDQAKLVKDMQQHHRDLMKPRPVKIEDAIKQLKVLKIKDAEPIKTTTLKKATPIKGAARKRAATGATTSSGTGNKPTPTKAATAIPSTPKRTTVDAETPALDFTASIVAVDHIGATTTTTPDDVDKESLKLAFCTAKLLALSARQAVQSLAHQIATFEDDVIHGKRAFDEEGKKAHWDLKIKHAEAMLEMDEKETEAEMLEGRIWG